MEILIFALIVITCIGIIGIVLIQNPKGGGISSSFGALNQIGGVKQTTEGVEKVTWGLAIFLVMLCLLATPYMRGGVTKANANPESSVQMNNLPQGAGAMPNTGGKPAGTKD
ncbi:MAG TPA: preprotein translocase subunit SecG [Flavobacteriales bacterium]|nr:preprotein translocase subunit SecG [Flavobacteriales bacterium]